MSSTSTIYDHLFVDWMLLEWMAEYIVMDNRKLCITVSFEIDEYYSIVIYSQLPTPRSLLEE